MSTVTIRPGNSIDVQNAIADENGDPFPLQGYTVFMTVKTQAGATITTRSMQIDGDGNIVASDNMTLASTADAGEIITSFSGTDTSFFTDGWARWFIEITDGTGNTYPVGDGSYKVESTTTYTVQNGVSRKRLRRFILQELGDLIVLNATADGSNVTLIDQRRLIGEPNAYRGMQCLITARGLNEGEERYVTGSSRDNRSITFDFALPEDTSTGDEAELANFRGTGYRFADIHRAMERAIENAADTATEPVIMDVDTAFARVPGVIAIPDDWVGISGVQFQNDSESPWQNLTYSSRILGSGWSVDRANRVIHVGGERGYRIDEKSLKIMGMRRPSVPTCDDDLIGINPEWLVAECVAHLSMSAYRRNPTQERQSVMAMDYQQAGILRSRVLKRSGAGQTVVRL